MNDVYDLSKKNEKNAGPTCTLFNNVQCFPQVEVHREIT